MLIISNECLSTVSSNGRTLRNFLLGWPKERLAQFHIRNVSPDYSVCSNYYHVSDKAALQAFLKGRPAQGKQPRFQQQAQNTQKMTGKKRNAVTMLLRNLVWNSKRWAGEEFCNWVEKFAPELILLQAGDCGFMLRLARELSEKYRIPLVIYNSEAYYFKRHDYFRSKGFPKLMYPIFYRIFCREFKKTIQMAAYSIYCCDKLKSDYDAVFPLPSEVIYTASEVIPTTDRESDSIIRVSYLGNLGVGRHEGLVEIGNVLQKISSELKLQVYGRIPNQEAERAFTNCEGIDYRGFVPYEEVIKIIHGSDIVIHTESFDDFYREDLKYAFSTKIADSLASGKCFLLYAPEELACSEYLVENNAAYVVKKQEELLPVLRKLCEDPQARSRYVLNALQLAQENHSAIKNTKRFQEILCESIKEHL